MTADLVDHLLAAERSSRWVASAMAAADDPFHLMVPPLVDPAAADIDAATLESLAGLYLLAEVEQTGLLAAAELLVTNRLSLDLTSVEASRLLEETADDSEEWVPRPAREQLFARVFGLGAGAAPPQAAVNREFRQLLADTCSAVTAHARAAALNGSLAAPRAQLLRATGRLRGNLALRHYGSTLMATSRIAAQARQAVTLLSHPGIIALARGQSAWDVVRATWPDEDQPDIERLVALGQSGQQVIGWSGAPEASRADPPAAVGEAASTWLLSAGFDAEVA